MNPLRLAAFPLAAAYDGLTTLRNYLYDRGIWESRSYDIPVICVGNLSTGGTGKSPMIEYLLGFLSEMYTVGVLSRGYKRKTKGYLEVDITHTPLDTGDEPLQIKKKFPDVTVAVCADRREGIERLRQKVEVVLLDDGFQHRRVKPSYNLILSPYNALYLDDYLLPMGNLRESRKGMDRADMIVVTKCPDPVPYSFLQEIEFRIPQKDHQKLYFSRITYGKTLVGSTEEQPLDYLKGKPFTLVTGIANPLPLVNFLHRRELEFVHLRFPDHHDFSDSELARLKNEDLLITTEKDYMRLAPKLGKYALYYLPIGTEILNEQGVFMQQSIIEHIEKFRA